MLVPLPIGFAERLDRKRGPSNQIHLPIRQAAPNQVPLPNGFSELVHGQRGTGNLNYQQGGLVYWSQPDVLVAGFAGTREVRPGVLVARTQATAATRNTCI
jgi:hypothetical protein